MWLLHNTVQLDLHLRGSLPSSRHRRRPHAALRQQGSHTLHLAEISKAVAPGAHAVVLSTAPDGTNQADGSSCLTASARLSSTLQPRAEPAGEHLAVPPPNYLSNCVFNTYTAIVDACCTAWNALIQPPQQITSIASRNWAKQVTV